MSGDARQRYPFPLQPFLQLQRLRKLRLGAVSHVKNTMPLPLELDTLPQLEELYLNFVAGQVDGGLSVDEPHLSNVPLGQHLKTLQLRGLGSRDTWLHPQLAKRLAACPKLSRISLEGPKLQKGFLNELSCCLEQGLVRAPSVWSVDWTWCRLASPKARCVSTAHLDQLMPSCSEDNETLRRLAHALSRKGAALQVQTNAHATLDVRISCEKAVDLEEHPGDGLEWYGKGMEWFIGGVAPTALSIGQSATFNNRYVSS